MKIKHLFLDLDDTILDFHRAERIAIAHTFASFGLNPTEQVLTRYHEINRMHWERLERKEETRQQVQENRFADLFAEMGLVADPAAIAKSYEHNLGIGHYFLPGALEAVQSLHKKYTLYLASNGTASVQDSRLESAGLYPYFAGIFISQRLGHDKPSRAFFDAATAGIEGFDPGEALMVGDSLTSDILGGIQAGMRTCWINPGHKPGRDDIRPDYEIENIMQLEALLDTID